MRVDAAFSRGSNVLFAYIYMRVFAIPHFYGQPRAGATRWHGAYKDPEGERAAKLSRLINGLHSLFGPNQCIMQLACRRTDAANESLRDRVRIFVVTDGEHHLLERLQVPSSSFQEVRCRMDPQHLGFAAHRVLADQINEAEWLCYLEDDLLLHDAMWFWKLRHFLNVVGPESVLMPQRYEMASDAAAQKAYVDGDLRAESTAAFQDVSDAPQIDLPALGGSIPLLRASNPHSGSFFVHVDQMRRWAGCPDFGKPTQAWIGPLESAATLGVMKNFRVYKPAATHAGFFEIEHQSQQFIRQLRRPDKHPSTS